MKANLMLAKNCSIGDILQIPDEETLFLFIIKKVHGADPNEGEGITGIEINIKGDSIEYISGQYVDWAMLGSYKKANFKKLKAHGRLLVRLLFSDRVSRTVHH